MSDYDVPWDWAPPKPSWQDRLLMSLQYGVKRALWLRHGKPEPADTKEALRALGLLAEVHPIDAAAFWHDTFASLEAYTRLDRVLYGHPSWQLYVPGEGWIVVLDLRPALERMGVAVKAPEPA